MKGGIFIGEVPHFPDWTAAADMVDQLFTTVQNNTNILVYFFIYNSVIVLRYAGLRTRQARKPFLYQGFPG